MKQRPDRCFTVIIAPNSTGKVRQFTVDFRRLYAGLFAGLLLLLGGAYGAFRYLYAMDRLGHYDDLITQNTRIQEENEVYRHRTGQLSDRIAHIELLAKNISHLSGVDYDNPESAAGGQGGYSPDTPGTPSGMNDLQRVDQKSVKLEKHMQRLKDLALEQSLLTSSMPTAWPLKGYIASPFGYRTDPIAGGTEYHEGIDISAPYGARVAAPADGVVLFAGVQNGYGYTVVLGHRYGITTRYGHLSSYSVRVGQRLQKGESLGFVGSTGRSTGPHLHYEVLVNQKAVNPFRFLGMEPAGA